METHTGDCQFCERKGVTVKTAGEGAECLECFVIYTALRCHPARFGGNVRTALRLAMDELRNEKRQNEG